MLRTHRVSGQYKYLNLTTAVALRVAQPGRLALLQLHMHHCKAMLSIVEMLQRF